MSQKSKHTDVDKESLRLEYCFEKGINFKDRVIQITGPIEEASSFDYLDAALTEMERDSKRGVTLKINSPGGSVYEALAMVDRIQDSRCHVITKCYGHAMSAASLLLASGNFRQMGSRAWLMHHEISGPVEGTLSELKEHTEQMEREMEEWARAMSSFTAETEEFWLHAAHKRDFYLNAEQCLALGVVDKIF